MLLTHFLNAIPCNAKLTRACACSVGCVEFNRDFREASQENLSIDYTALNTLFAANDPAKRKQGTDAAAKPQGEKKKKQVGFQLQPAHHKGGEGGGRPTQTHSQVYRYTHTRTLTQRQRHRDKHTPFLLAVPWIQEVTLLDPKTSFNANIVLTSMHTNVDGVLAALEELKEGDERLPEHVVRSLNKLLPGPEDVQVLQSYDGDLSLLNGAERFLCRLIKVCVCCVCVCVVCGCGCGGCVLPVVV